MTPLPITSVAALFTAVIILLLTLKVIQLRRRGGVVLGDNNDRPLTKAIRGHANAVEQIPIALILMGLAEAQGGGTTLLTLCAAGLVLGRASHGIYFSIDGTHWRLRMIGMSLTLLAQIGLIVSLALAMLGQF